MLRFTLTNGQRKNVANASIGMVQVSVAGIVLPYVLERSDPILVVLGLFLAIFFFTASMHFSKNVT